MIATTFGNFALGSESRQGDFSLNVKITANKFCKDSKRLLVEEF